ncbi:PepSY-associated TM helix domain-containing protein [Membranihabitans maritimus]|uniref:PepSY-associated TM helix domain-containing protein n=1 Tax=Membranihabitans maritimus TaxID=2904244 RepID=UPI001F410EAF|nr:PepSY-associated TM helix domain-containing protein [Membranihabitans maritimus]
MSKNYSIGTRIKKVFGKIHLWLGLGTGLLFFIICISGAILTWKPEISSLLYKEKVENEQRSFAPIPKFKSVLEKAFPEGDFRTIHFGDSISATKVLLFVPGTYYYAFLNPYSAEIIHLQDMKKGWLNKLVPLHRNLLLGKVGEEVVHWVTLISFILLFTGIYLWWPRNGQGMARSLQIKWGSRFKRINYDLHKTLGFYSLWIGILSVLTGIFWGFSGVQNALQMVTGEQIIEYDTPRSKKPSKVKILSEVDIMEKLAKQFRRNFPKKSVNISMPHSETDPIHITVIDSYQRVYSTDHYYYDRYSGKQISGSFKPGSFSDKSTYSYLNGLVYDIHLGNILGFWGRLLLFISTLFISTLPITGFLIWWGRRNKKSRKTDAGNSVTTE